MKQLKLLFGFLCCGALVWTCVPTGTPSLFLNAIEDSTGARIDISATEGDGTIGKGVVTLTPSNGTLDQTSVTLDSFGAGSVRLDCNPSTDATCLTGRVVARWTPKNATAPVEEEVRLHFGNIGMDGGTGGGSGGSVVFDGGINRITNECLGHVPELYPTCCRTNQEFGKQQPKCPAVQMQPGATFPVAFDGFSSNLSTTPFATGVVFNVTFQGPTAIMSAAECSLAATATLNVDYNGETVPVGGTVVNGRLTTQVWVGTFAGGGGIAPMATTLCSENGGYPSRIAYYVTMQGLSFTGSDLKFWRETGAETYFYTVALARF